MAAEMHLIPLAFLIIKNQLIGLQNFASKCFDIVNSERHSTEQLAQKLWPLF